MQQQQLFQMIADTYQIKPNYPWQKYPSFAVFRHLDNEKWFCLYMEVSADKLGLQGQDIIAIINVKANPVLIGSLTQIDGILPAYHMNKEHWLSVILSKVDDKQIMALIDDSFYLTNNK